MQLCGSLSILWHCLSLGLEWKLTFSSPVATAEFSKFAGFLRSTWLHIPGCLALGEWSHHRDYLGREDLFLYSSSVYSCHLFLIPSTSVRTIPFLSFIEPIFAWNIPLVSLIFLKRSLVFPHGEPKQNKTNKETELMTKMLITLMEKVDNMQEQMGNWGRFFRQKEDNGGSKLKST